ncbi:MAG: hypothetical protein IKE22_10715 [Atopobiaceae bacterium]|nr:hypothetical protein [Atopobiaceae bacterium]
MSAMRVHKRRLRDAAITALLTLALVVNTVPVQAFADEDVVADDAQVVEVLASEAQSEDVVVAELASDEGELLVDEEEPLVDEGDPKSGGEDVADVVEEPEPEPEVIDEPVDVEEDEVVPEEIVVEDVSAIEAVEKTDAAEKKDPEQATEKVAEVAASPADQQEKPVTGPITESGTYRSATGEAAPIVISGDIDVVLYLSDGLTIDAGEASAIDILDGARVTLVVEGTVVLSGANGVHVPAPSSVQIMGDGDLVANANGKHGCGIGHYGAGDAGNIVIQDLNSLVATGGEADKGRTDEKFNNVPAEGGAAIGGGRSGVVTDEYNPADYGHVTITNVANVTATGGCLCAGIGSGFHRGSTVLIENCMNVVAMGGWTAAAIGGGRNSIEGVPLPEGDTAGDVVGNFVTIISSCVTAFGGDAGAGIGGGYCDLSIGDYARDLKYQTKDGEQVYGADLAQSTIVVNIEDSTINAHGGLLGAGIGGGYKMSSPHITISGNSNVYAEAGAAGIGGSKVATGIGSGADGSGIFSDASGSIDISAGSHVTSFGRGYSNVAWSATKFDGSTIISKGDKNGALSSKWAIGRELEDSSTASVASLRFLTYDFFLEQDYEHSFVKRSAGDISFFTPGQKLIVRALDGSLVREIQIPENFDEVALDLPAGDYQFFAEGSDVPLSHLPTEGYSATTRRTVYAQGPEDVTGSYRDYTYTYQPYGSASDLTTLHYAFGRPTTIFTVGAGINSFDAVAFRPVSTYTVTYMDGVGGAAFATQVIGGIPYLATTPFFDGVPTRDGFTFQGWAPEVAERVTGDITYVALWTANAIPGPGPEPGPGPTPEPTPTPTPTPTPAPIPTPTLTPTPVVPTTIVPTLLDAAPVTITTLGLPTAATPAPDATVAPVESVASTILEEATPLASPLETISDDAMPLAYLPKHWSQLIVVVDIMVAGIYVLTVLHQRSGTPGNLAEEEIEGYSGSSSFDGYDTPGVIMPDNKPSKRR